MDQTSINPFIMSARCVFETMLQMPLEVGQPAPGSAADAPYEVVAVIRFSGDIEGEAVLAMPQAIARRIVTLLVGAEVTSREDLSDGVGELVDMIAGGAKAQFEGERVEMSCPSVVIGAGRPERGPGGPETTVIPLCCDCGRFVIEVSLRKMEAAAALRE